MKIALSQMNIAWLDPEKNLRTIRQSLSEVDRQGASIVLFPEMALSGFSMEPEKAALTLESAPIRALIEATRDTDATVVCGAAIHEAGRFTNRALVLRRGKLLGDYSKINLFTFSGEDKVYAPGGELFFFERDGLTFCPLICYDLRFSELFLKAAERVTGAFLVIANWPEARVAHWKTLLQARALDTQAPVIGVNRVGSGGKLNYVGASGAFSARGEALVPFAEGEGVFFCDLDTNESSTYRKSFPNLIDRKLLHEKLDSGITLRVLNG